jgi:iron complex transport system substrate-binding protein
MLDREIRAFMPVVPRGERAFLFGILIVALAAMACERTPAHVSTRATAQRIVSLLPAATDVLLALGATDRIVGRTDYDSAASLVAVASFGRTLAPSVEAILALNPDLVILPDFSPDLEATRALLRGQQVGVLAPRLHLLADLRDLIDSLALLTGRTAQARVLNDSIGDALARLGASTTVDSPSVLYLIWHDPPTVAGRNTYIDQLITIAGARNAGADLSPGWSIVSLEEVLRRAPDYIVLPVGKGHPMRAAGLATRPGWRELTAFRSAHVIEVDGDLFSQLGPHIVEAAATLRRELHRHRGTK